MVYDFYRRLSLRDQRTYRRSDAISAVVVPADGRYAALVSALERALASGRRGRVGPAASQLVTALCGALEVPMPAIEVLPRRPKDADGELHGLYTLEPDGRAKIQVWMRTSEQERVVAFRTFLRTLLHELCHHLDFFLFDLPETFHTQGFFKRESSLVRSLAPAGPRPRSTRAEQLSLFD